ncbi:MAG: hypothetical protein AUK47_16715 [Deltaproteobacteria bacterium CG2_30_63_29]|nr:MAG: hypothetical protein AUK47_16715 [Deltaproteobacteria bacterium CG2_30_63_29]
MPTEFRPNKNQPSHTNNATHVQWLIRLRWFCIAVLLVVLVLARLVGLDIPTELGWLVLMTIGANTVWSVGARHALEPQRHIMAQTVVDVLLLAALIHYSGGIDNPLQLVFVLQVAIVSVILPRRRVLILVGAVVLVHNAVVVGEGMGFLAHHPLALGAHAKHDMAGDALWQQPEFLVIYGVAFSATVIGVAYLVGGLVVRLEESLQEGLERQRLDLARARLARIGTLSSGVAHAIRNPLHGMFNCLEILGKAPERAKEEEELLSLLHEGVSRIERVTRRLLAMSRDVPLDLRETDLSHVIDEAISLSSVRALEQKTIVRALDPVPLVWLDSDRFAEALSNIIDNGLDASTPGASVEVRCRLDASNNQIELVVQDHGAGIANEFLPRVFDPFFSTKTIGEGSGLGLAIALEVFEEHGFALSILSEVGEGTSVQLSIPLQSQ